MTTSIRVSAAASDCAKDWTDVSLTGPPRCDALPYQLLYAADCKRLVPQVHEHALELFAGSTEMLEIDDDLSDLR